MRYYIYLDLTYVSLGDILSLVKIQFDFSCFSKAVGRSFETREKTRKGSVMGRMFSWPLTVFGNLQSLFLVVLMTGISFLVFAQVLLRYVFCSPLMGIEELLFFPTSWLYFFGAVKASEEGVQVVARVLEIFLKRKKSVWLLRFIGSCCSFAVLVWLTRWGWDYWKYAFRVKKLSATLLIPMVWAEATVLIGFVLMSFYTLLETFRYLMLWKNTPASELVEREAQL